MTDATLTPFVPDTAADSLALEIAEAFGDTARLFLYRRVCATHDRSVVHKAFRESMEIPAHQIRKSRPAIFFAILYAYDHRNGSRR